MSNFFNIFLLTWKNFKLQLRHPWLTAVELLIPVLLLLVMVIMHFMAPVEVRKMETVFDSYDIDALPEEFNTSEAIFLFYSPQSKFLDNIIKEVSNALNVHVKGFDTEEELVASYKSSSVRVVAAVIFNASLKDGVQNFGPIQFKIRPENLATDTWNLTSFMPRFPSLEITDKSEHGTLYMSSGFLPVQHAVAKTLLQYSVSNSEEDFDKLFLIRMCRQPYPPYIFDSFYKVHELYIILLIAICFFLPTALVAKNVVYERQTKLKQSLKMMGVSNWENWAACFTKDFIFFGFCSLIMTIMLCTRFGGRAIFNLSDASLIFLLLVMHASVLIAFTFFISSFFDKAHPAVAATCIFYILTFLPYVHYEAIFHQVSFILKLILCILPSTLLSASFGTVFRLERFGKGVQWTTAHGSELFNIDLSLNMLFLMLFIDTLIYLILAWYVEVMRTGPCEEKYPWYFPLTAAYWTDQKDIPALSSAKYRFIRPQFERDPSKVKPMIDVRNLTKIYNKTSEPVVNRIDLKAYKGQITALLGYHFTGKTTFASMISGSLLPTSGTIILKGHNMHKTGTHSQIAPLLGLCPEYDVSVDGLNVEENLYFFCRLKGFNLKGIYSEISHILSIFDLDIEKNKLVSFLSPSAKRRLSVAIALIGQSEIVILDEPTAFMNSHSQRIVWDALRSEKKHRAIFLTTTHIAEADAIADKIAVIDNGELKCCGSPSFLKRAYAAGYVLKISKQPNCNSVAIQNLILSKIPSALFVSDTVDELKIMLPHDSCHLYQVLFKELEDKDLKISCFTVSETTLDDLFKRIVCDNFNPSDDAKDRETEKGVKKASNFHSLSKQRNEGFALFYQHVIAGLRKHYMFSMRNTFLTALQLFALPLVFLFSHFFEWDIFMSRSSANSSTIFDIKTYKKSEVVYGIDPHSNYTIDLGDIYASMLSESEFMYLVDLDEENYLSYLVKQAMMDFKKYQTKYIIGAVFAKDINRTLITALYNSDVYHAAPISLQYIHNTILSYYTKGKDYFIDVKNEPLPFRDRNHKFVEAAYNHAFSFLWCEDLMTGMAILISSFVVLPVIEESSKFKMQQMISGLDAFVYWFSTFIYDYFLYLIPCTLSIVVISVFEHECLSEASELGPLVLLLLLHGLSALLFVYCCSFCSNSASAAYAGIFLYYVLGLILSFVIYSLETENKFHISQPLDTLFTVLMPSHCVGRGIFSIYRNCVGAHICNNPQTEAMCFYKNASSFISSRCCPDTCRDSCIRWKSSHFSLSTPGIGKQLIALAVHACVFIIMLIFLEMRFFQSLKGRILKRKEQNFCNSKLNVDKTVLEETENIVSSPLPKLFDHNYHLILKNVSKFFCRFAFRKLSFAVKRGECFGLLGVDAAGKSTLLKMICGFSQPSAGSIYIDGFNIFKYPHTVLDKVGFSPGDCTLLRDLTVKETLALYARIRGIPEKEIHCFIGSLVTILSLKSCALIKNCNNTVRRKIGVAIAIIGNPPLILLDEPTSEMDPVSCRSTQEAVRQALGIGCTVLFTSKSMDECRTLCNRAGILVNGNLAYIGNLNQLEKQYEGGFTLILRILKASQTGLTRVAIFFKGFAEEVKAIIEDAEPDAVLKTEYNSYLNYYIPHRSMKLSKLFGMLDKMVVKELIFDYSIMDTNLDQIFSYYAFHSDSLEDKKIADYLKERQYARY